MMFSITVWAGTSLRCWCTIPIPRLIASSGDLNLTCFPPRKISPSSGWYCPKRIFIRVDFPAPFSPKMAWISPALISKSIWSLATTPGNLLVIPRASKTVSPCLKCFSNILRPRLLLINDTVWDNESVVLIRSLNRGTRICFWEQQLRDVC